MMNLVNRAIVLLVLICLSAGIFGTSSSYGNESQKKQVLVDSLSIDGIALGEERSKLGPDGVAWSDKTGLMWIGKNSAGREVHVYFDEGGRVETIYGSRLTTIPESELLVQVGRRENENLGKRLNSAATNGSFGDAKIAHYVLRSERDSSPVHLFVRIEGGALDRSVTDIVLSKLDNYP